MMPNQAAQDIGGKIEADIFGRFFRAGIGKDQIGVQ